MGLFNLFKRKKKKEELPIEALKWNKMWDLWSNEKADSPYAELMTYLSEVNNGGHMQFFDNVSSVSNLSGTVSELYTILPIVLKESLEKGYDTHLKYEAGEGITEEIYAEIMDACDDKYYANETEIEHILKEYAATMTL
ncbi:MAG: hypothetical protein IJY11_03160 [Clostridia bacterium]|nr:hypothetical protein [Clostridia bacterium]